MLTPKTVSFPVEYAVLLLILLLLSLLFLIFSMFSCFSFYQTNKIIIIKISPTCISFCVVHVYQLTSHLPFHETSPLCLAGCVAVKYGKEIKGRTAK